MPFVVGETIGPYRLVEQLGQGGMATVYKAYHAALDRYVAIKALHPALLEDVGFLARFQREARLVARLEHPNIVPVYDFSEHEGRPYLVMKYIQGQTLKAYMTDHQLDMKETLRIVEAVGSALSCAHQQDVLHRDIKPSNVLMTGDGQIYLADFGLARMAANTSSTMSGDMLIGTPQYISPEQAISRPDLDARTDIYSFGVMLYEMVVGRVPFSSDTPFSIIHDHIYSPLPMPRKIKPDVPEAVERVLLKALAKDRDDRYQNVNAMVQAFRMAVAGTVPGNVTQRVNLPPEVVLDSEKTLHDGDQTEEASAPRREQTLDMPVQSRPSPGEPVRSRSKLWVALLGVVAVGVIALLLFGSFNQIRKQRISATRTAQAQGAVSGTVVSAVTVAPAGEQSPTAPIAPVELAGLSPAAQGALKDAFTAWKNGDLPGAMRAMETVRNENINNPDMILPTLQYLEDREAWLLAGMYGFMSYDQRPALFTSERVTRLHMVIYRAARDPLFGDYFTKTQQNPLFGVANLRYRLYYGADTQEIQSSLAKLGGSSLFAKRFPEARLLEAEIAVKMGDNQRAKIICQEILDQTDMPEWVKDEARLLNSQNQ